MNDLKTISILFRAYYALLNNAKQSLDTFQLNFNEFMILEALHHQGMMHVSELSERILVPISSLSYNLQQLKKRGLITSMPAKQDRRIQTLAISEKGTAFFVPVYQKHFKAMREILNVLTEKEEALLQNLLKQLGYEAERGLKT